MALTRDALLKAANDELPREAVSVPELGGTVYVRGMSGMERDAWEKSLVHRRRDGSTVFKTENVRARLAVKVLVDEHGARLLQDDDAAVVGKLPAAILQRVFDAAQRLSGISDEDVDDLKNGSAEADGTGSSTN